jgi:hypothetical protein
MVVNTLTSWTNSDIFKVPISDVCGMFVDFSRASNAVGNEYVFVSNWLAMMLFFFGYMSSNAINLIIKAPTDDSKSEAIANRKTQTYTGVVLCFIGLCLVLWYRYNSSCEIFPKNGGWLCFFVMLFAILLYGGLGVGWYSLLSMTADQRLSDLFGIANRLLLPSAYQNGPVACVPSA